MTASSAPLRTRLEAFLRGSLVKFPAVVEVILRQAQSSGKYGTVVDRWSPSSDLTPEVIAASAALAAESDVEAFTDRQAYALTLHARDGVEPVARFAFALLPASIDDADGTPYPSEDHTLAGQLRQQQRHNEAVARINATMIESILRSKDRQIDSLMRVLDTFERREVKLGEYRAELVEQRVEIERERAGQVIEQIEAGAENSWQSKAIDAAKGLLMLPGVGDAVGEVVTDILKPKKSKKVRRRRKKVVK